MNLRSVLIMKFVLSEVDLYLCVWISVLIVVILTRIVKLFGMDSDRNDSEHSIIRALKLVSCEILEMLFRIKSEFFSDEL